MAGLTIKTDRYGNVQMEPAAWGVIGVIAGAGVTAAKDAFVSLRGKRTRDVTTLEVHHTDSNQQLIDRLMRETELLSGRLDRVQAQLDGVRMERDTQLTINRDLESKIADNKRQLEGMQDDARKHRQDCEETISKLTDENATLRSQLSAAQLELQRKAKGEI